MTCPSINNESQFGWDECSLERDHQGDHHDKISGARWPQGQGRDAE